MEPVDLARRVTRASLVTLVGVGACAFGLLFLTSYLSPRTIEKTAQEYLRATIEQSVAAQLGTDSDSLLGRVRQTGALGAALAQRADSLRRVAQSGMTERVANVLAALCCDEGTGEARAASVRSALEAEATAAEARLVVLHDYVVGAYQARVAALVSELRLFSGVNAALFVLVGVLLFTTRADMRPTLVPIAVLLVATLGATSLYITQQNWFWNILLGDYMGGWYVVLVAVIGAFAADIAVLRGRVSLELLSHVPSVLIPPC